ncbi:hypothetical protein O0I10_006284 [Lichtheimia ornata]|uniref:F-box domain-containing protein n=1 Tax=Lichtheimia ornata TaxID=688661 RepID=A0AAD7XYW6_9FUNG|nr:uncharacterized protein O0I10_006284 [Lichtheimia ornata]KAJ8658013.1 hypothetical protein O0I10_006284 [Lichtheimia ornata]
MADSIWHALCKHPTQPVSTEKYSTIVDHATTQLHEPIHSILTTLDRRAMALTKLANFESALHDAKAMQQLSSSSALGYIREADIYSEQGKQLQVIDVCSKGMTMADTMDKHYDDLKRVKMDAEQRQNACIDFISQLPMDIVITMLIPMFMYFGLWDSFKPDPSMHVSHEWRNRIVQSFNGLRIRLYEYKVILDFIPLARHITALDIFSFTGGTWLCDLLRNNDFCSLKELAIERFTADCMDQLVDSLKSISTTLTHFQIEPLGKAMLPITDILGNCPNLKSLEVNRPSATDISSLPMMTWPKLTTLIICSNVCDIITSDKLKAIGERFPSLKKLSLSPWQDMESTRVVLDYYPWMNSIDIVKSCGGFNIAYYQKEPRCKGNGVTHIDVQVYGMKEDAWKNAIYILLQHHETLECMKFNVEAANGQEEVYNIEYPCLKRLSLAYSGSRIPRHAPMLEELEIRYLLTDEVCVVPDSASTKLTKLVVEMDLPMHAGANPPFERYLHQLAQHSHLKELDVTFNSVARIDNVVEAMFHLGTLERLMMFVTSEWECTSTQRFLVGLAKGCPNLSCFGISCNTAPSACSINALKQLAHLERFGFSIEGMDGDDAFWNAIETFPQLKNIYVFPANETNMYRLRYLKGKRLDLKITITRWLNEI